MGQKIETRKRTAKESDVYLDGQLVPRKKLRKEISRQGYITLTEKLNQVQGESLKALKLYLRSLTAIRNASSNASWV
jgi:hypothetical protein